MLQVKKIRSNVYLDKELKEQAKEMFKKYGLSLSDGINFLMKNALDNNVLPLDIEQVKPDDPDYKIIQDGLEARKKGEKSYSLSEAKQILGF